MPDIVINLYAPFENSKDFNPFTYKIFRRFVMLTDNYTGTAPTVTFKLDGATQSPITGEQVGAGGHYHFWLTGRVGREITDVVVTLVAAADNTANIRYFVAEYDERRRLR